MRCVENSGEVGSYLLGELNLCLRPQDTVLSGPSITKALNAASNKMIKNLLILNSPGRLHSSASWVNESWIPGIAPAGTQVSRVHSTSYQLLVDVDSLRRNGRHRPSSPILRNIQRKVVAYMMSSYSGSSRNLPVMIKCRWVGKSSKC